MGVMKELATELELHWQTFPIGGYRRQMPNGDMAMIKPAGDRWRLTAGEWQLSADTLPEAVAVAGRLAREQLTEIAETWAAA
jgi:hypothetical protein